MVQILNLVVTLLATMTFALFVPLERLFDAFQPMVVVLSVLIAAVFVRLNRGMPTLEWKSIEKSRRANLTEKVVQLSKEYVWVVLINSLALFLLITLTAVGKNAAASYSDGVKVVLSAGVGALFSLSLSRMAYIIWRDCDIMKTQKYVIDGAAENEARKEELDKAEEKIKAINEARI